VRQCSEREIYDVVGPVCETGDTFARNREMSMVEEDQLVAIASAGAYGAVMSSTYNSRLQIPEVLVNQNTFHVIKPRGSYQSMIELDSLAPWQ
jgi:diaminopimelate decarboxylase